MPLIPQSSYRPPPFLRGGHIQTCLASVWRRVPGVTYDRQRIETADGDFLDLDWARGGARRLAVLAHGLEGDSKRAYVLGMVRALGRRGWDALAWNARGCSGEPNRTLRFTHSGATEDLEAVLAQVFESNRYDRIALIGFSLGGNLTLKYLGERAAQLDSRIVAAVAFSVPCDLESGSVQLARWANRIYMRRFLSTLNGKLRAMMRILPGKIDLTGYHRMRTFKDFDERYTAPFHGFKDALDYWRRCSCRQYLEAIRIPTLLINARNDPFLAPACFPEDEARQNPLLELEIPAAGGHVGFIQFNPEGEYWSEKRAAAYLARWV